MTTVLLLLLNFRMKLSVCVTDQLLYICFRQSFIIRHTILTLHKSHDLLPSLSYGLTDLTPSTLPVSNLSPFWKVSSPKDPTEYLPLLKHSVVFLPFPMKSVSFVDQVSSLHIPHKIRPWCSTNRIVITQFFFPCSLIQSFSIFRLSFTKRSSPIHQTSIFLNSLLY